jgi:hypothetical protein
MEVSNRVIIQQYRHLPYKSKTECDLDELFPIPMITGTAFMGLCSGLHKYSAINIQRVTYVLFKTDSMSHSL